MKVFSVCGISGSGKTTTIENIIKELVARGYRVGSVKDIHRDGFTIDPVETANTRRHKAAGSTLVCARGFEETSMLYPTQLPMDKILDFYEKDYDWVVLEGVDCIAVPTIVTAHTAEDLAQKWSAMSIAVSGRISCEISEHNGKPAIDATTGIKQLVDLLELNVYERLPNFPPECCGACGMQSCGDLAAAIVGGTKRRSDCVADQGIELFINEKRILMVPFVQAILKNALVGVVSELEGYEKGCQIDIKLFDNLLQIQEK
ncbi:MAG: molybdopterin-guanine dinucleotide biosynthesis protein MobB [Defluviitaleaceae bacterium]|nr:molybdopterin-guanine dinucleotide biosynthesis protein MobB [Defluviitaleaceae bacterium]